jgi:hypothetical protein
MLMVMMRTTAEAAGPVILKDQDGCEYSLTKDDKTQKFHLSKLDNKAEAPPREMSLKLLGEDGQPEEVRLQAVPKSGRDGFAEYEGVSKSGQESFVGVELKISFGPGEKDHVLRSSD